MKEHLNSLQFLWKTAAVFFIMKKRNTKGDFYYENSAVQQKSTVKGSPWHH